jgi:hypothetical protein
MPTSPRPVHSAIQTGAKPVPYTPQPYRPTVPQAGPSLSPTDGPVLPPIPGGKPISMIEAKQAGTIRQVSAIATTPIPETSLEPVKIAVPSSSLATRSANGGGASPLPAPILALLRQRVEQACAGQTREIQVTARSKQELTVHLKVSQKYDREKVAYRVLQLPELQPYAVQMEVEEVP